MKKVENSINEQEFVFLKEGVYNAKIIKKHRTIGGHYNERVMLCFEVKCDEKYYELAKYYQIKRAYKPIGKSGKFIAKARGDQMFDFYKILPNHPRIRPDQMPMSKLRGKKVKITVRTVRKNHKKQITSESMFYSVVGEILHLRKSK